MKSTRSILFGLASAWLLSSCACESTQNQVQVSSDTLQQHADSTALADTLSFPTNMLDKLVIKKPKAKTALEAYKQKLTYYKQVTGDSSILGLFTNRDMLVNAIQYEVLEDYFQNVLPSSPNAQKDEEAFEKELTSIGLGVVRAEGQYVGLCNTPVLAARLSEVASESMKLYISMMLEQAKTMGGEYPYTNIEPQMNVVRLGEKLRKDFSSSPLNTLSENWFKEASSILTDVHQGGDQCIVLGDGTDPYPWSCNFDDYKKFASSYKDTKLSSVTAKIMDNVSVSAAEGELYVIACDWHDSQEKAKEAAFAAITAGKDLPHVLTVGGNEGTRYLHAYRFYTDEAKAKSELAKGQALFKAAQIIKLGRGESKELVGPAQ